MQRSKNNARARRGAIYVEAAILLPVFFLLILGTIDGGMRVSRYQWVAAMARQGARWASVHGPTYSSESGQPLITSTSVYKTISAQMSAVGFNLANVTCTMTPSPMTTTTKTVAVTISYQEKADNFFAAGTSTSTSVMPITY